MKVLEQFGIVPVNSAVLQTVMHDYRSLKDKIVTLEKSGDLIRLKKGLYENPHHDLGKTFIEKT